MVSLSDAPVHRERGRRAWAWGVLIGVLALHLVLCCRLFPSTGPFVRPDEPTIVVDHAIHLYHGALGSRFLRERGRTWGIDPFFMAGYPETPVWDSSSNLAILFQAIPGGGYRPRAYNIGLLATAILALVAVAAGSAVAGLDPMDSALASALAGVYFWAGAPIVFWRSGLFAFVLTSATLVLLLGLAIRFHERPGRVGWAALTGTGALMLFAHATAPVMALGGVLGFFAATARRLDRRRAAALAASAAVVVGTNLVWLVPLWNFRGIRRGGFSFLTADSPRLLVAHYLGHSLDGRIGLALLVLGAIGLCFWWAEGSRVRAASFGGCIGSLLLLCGLGGFWSVTRTLEPLRFLAPLDLVLAVPAGSALGGISRGLVRLFGGKRRGVVLAGLTWGAVLFALAVEMAGMIVGAALHATRSRPLVVGLRPEMRGLVRWIREETDPSARILFEDQLRLLEATDPESVHWTPLLPMLLGPEPRQFIGGLYQTAFIAHHEAAAFGDFRLGDRPIDEWTPEGIAHYCEMYNVGWVICWSPLSRFVFDRLPRATRVATLSRYSSPGLPVSSNPHEWEAIASRAGMETAERYMTEGEGLYAIYRVDRPHSYVLKGSGRLVASDLDRVEFADLVPEAGEVVISLHWFDAWRAEPRVPIGPAPVPGDPVPFVRIKLPGPCPRLILSNARGWRGG